jgi:hypothetical protein
MKVIGLLTSANVQIAADGTGTISIGPTVYGSTWKIDYTSVTNTGNDSSSCSVYQDLVADTSFLEATRNGNSDTTDTKFVLGQGASLVFVWRNATPGSFSTVVLRGTQESPR